MRSSRTRWVSGVGAVLVVGGLVLASDGGGVRPAAAGGNTGNGQMQCNREGTSCWPVQGNSNGGNQNHGNPPPPPQANPFTKILEKLDEILAAITGIGGGGDGNHTLRWDTNNPSASRFTTAFPGAVLDKNTGLVWEQAPDATPQVWDFARRACLNKNVGGTRGWRLSSVVELTSLIDPSLPTPFVPASVFTGVQSAGYWSATTSAANPTNAWFVNFNNGNVSNFGNKTDSNPAWCVRGPMQESVY